MSFSVEKRLRELEAQRNSKVASVKHDIGLKQTRIADTGTPIPEGEKSNEGFLWKTLDLLDRPANALRVGANNYLEGKYVGKGMLEGLKGDKHVYGSQILDTLGMQDGAARKIAGFGIDVLADPLLFAGAPIKAGATGIKSATKAGSLANKAATEVAEKGLLSSVVKAPFKAVDEGLTRAGVNPELKFLFKETNNPLTRVVKAAGDTAPGQAVSRKYVQLADNLGSAFSPDNYVKKNYNPIKVGDAFPDYETGRKALKEVTKTTKDASKAAQNSALVAMKRTATDLTHYTPDQQVAVRNVLEDFPRRIEVALQTTDLNPVEAQWLRHLGTQPETTYRKIVKQADEALNIVQNPDKYTEKALEQAQKTLDRTARPITIYEQLAKESDDYVAKWVQDNEALRPLYESVRDRMVKMSEKEGLENTVKGYMPRYMERTSLTGGKITKTQLPSSAEMQNALNQGLPAHKRRKFLTTDEAVQRAQQNWEEAGQIAKNYLTKEGVDTASKYDKVTALRQAGKSDEAMKLWKQFTTDDMLEAINRGLDVNEIPPLLEVAETFGEALIQREIQHSTNIAAKRLLDDLVKQGAAFEDIPNAKSKLSKILSNENHYRAQLAQMPPTAPNRQAVLDALNNTLAEKQKLQEFLRVRPHFVNAGDLAIPQGKNMLVHKQVAETLDRMSGSIALNKDLQQLNNTYRTALGYFKQSVTGMNPGWYVTNLVGNVYNAYLGGLKNPNRYKIAALLQADTKQSREQVSKFLAKHRVLSLKASKSGKTAFMQADELLEIVRKQGLEGFSTSYDNLGTSYKAIQEATERAAAREGMSLPGKAVSAVSDVGTTIKEKGFKEGAKQVVGGTRVLADAMETNAKVALFLDYLVKHASDDMSYAAMKNLTKDARDHAFKYLFDYSDITAFEGKVRDFVPFYTFQRKNVPLQFEELLKQPEKFAQFHRLREGTLQDDYTQEEIDQMPAWLRERAIGAGRGRLLTPNLPSESIDDVTNPRTYLGMLSPFITKPMELVTNQNFFTGAPIERFEGEQKQILGGINVSPQLRHILDTHGIVRGFNQATDNWNTEDTQEKAVSMLPLSPISRAVGRQYNPDVNELNYMYGYDRQLADLIKALKAKNIDVRTATEILKDARR